jgi:hypothetical protein
LAGGVPRAVKLLAAFSLSLFLIWDYAFPLTRFLYPAVAMMTVVSAYAIFRMFSVSPRWGRALLVLAVVSCLAINLSLGFFSVNNWSKASGMAYYDESDHDYLMRRVEDKGVVVLTSYPVYSYINDNLPGDAKVLIIGDGQHLYIQRRHVYTYLSAADPFAAFREHAVDPEAVRISLLRDGITHIVYNPTEMRRRQETGHERYPADQNERIHEFLNSPYAKPVYSGGSDGYQAYLFEITG